MILDDKLAAGGGQSWNFERAIPPDEFAAHCRNWVERGVQIIGGCRGISIDHMARMYETVPRQVGPRRPG